jgi:hypothetical protein
MVNAIVSTIGDGAWTPGYLESPHRGAIPSPGKIARAGTEGPEIRVHKLVLGLASEASLTLFSGRKQRRKKQKNGVILIRIKDTSFRAFDAMIQFIYTRDGGSRSNRPRFLKSPKCFFFFFLNFQSTLIFHIMDIS